MKNRTNKNRNLINTALLCTLVLIFGTDGWAQNGARKNEYGHWDGGLPLKTSRVFEFTTDEGTRIDLDVSPDGKTIVFALLGDIYSMPFGGGEARLLLGGSSIDTLPRFSPDGKRIAFASDRTGLANVWTMAPDGKDLRQVTHHRNVMDPGSPSVMRAVDWTPGGDALVVIQFFADRSAQFDYYRYDVGSGRGVLLAPPKVQHNNGTLSPDGKYLWYGMGIGRTTAGNDKEFTPGLTREELGTGKLVRFPVTHALVNSPRISPDGRLLAYRMLRWKGEYSGDHLLQELRVRKVDSAEPLENDPVVATCDGFMHDRMDQTSQYAFTPDSKEIVCTSNGKFRRIDIASRKVEEIPFTAKVRFEAAALNEFPRPDLSGPLKLRQLHSLNSDKNGKTVVFDAIGKVWVQRNGGGPKRLTRSKEREYNPVLSPDGKWIAYCTWSFAKGGRLWKVPVGSGEPVKLAEMKDAFSTPRWTPDGSNVIALRVESLPGANPKGGPPREGGIVSVDSSGGPPQMFGPVTAKIGTRNFNLPGLTIGRDGRIYFLPTDPVLIKTVRSVSFDGDEPRVHAGIKGFNVAAAVSADGKWLAVVNSFNICVMPMPNGEYTDDNKAPLIDLTGMRPEPTARQITTDGGAQPIWSADGKYLMWSWANRLFRLPYEQAISRTGPIKPQVTSIDLTVRRHVPTGTTLLKNARIVTMAGSGSPTVDQYKGQYMPTDPKVIERGDILIEGARIKAVGPSGTIAAPKSAKIVDLAGKTVVPGYIATHEHRVGHQTTELVPEQPPRHALYLSHGITTAQDPWGYYLAMYAEEMQAAGELVGPTWVGGLEGTIVRPSNTGGEEIPNYEAAEALVRKHKSSGAFLIKEYGQPHRIQRQWLAIAAAKYGIKLTAAHNSELALAHDGWNSNAHNTINAAQMYKDYMTLQRLSGLTADSYHGRTDVGLPPRSELSIRREIDDYERTFERGWLLDAPDMNVGSLKKRGAVLKGQEREARENGITKVNDPLRDLIGSGVIVSPGTDTVLGFLAFHGRHLNTPVKLGLTTAEVLRMATLNGARTLRMDADIGSIEAGKIADLVVLNSNPLDDIGNTRDIMYVVKSGEVYDPATMDVLWPTPRKFDTFPWAKNPNETGAAANRR